MATHRYGLVQNDMDGFVLIQDEIDFWDRYGMTHIDMGRYELVLICLYAYGYMDYVDYIVWHRMIQNCSA